LKSFGLHQFKIFFTWSEKGDVTLEVPKPKENPIRPSIRAEESLIEFLHDFSIPTLKRIECIKHIELLKLESLSGS
jgi:hypothetical protein